MPADYAKELGLPRPGGAEVQRVTRNSPASRAGVQVGDVIIEFNGKPVDDKDLVSVVAGTKPGATVPMRVVRDGKTLTLNITVEELSLEAERGDPAPEAPAPEGEAPQETDFGMAIQGLSPAERRQLRLPSGRGGVVVSNVTPFGPAAQAGIVEDDVILSIAGSPVQTPGDVTEALGRLTNGRIARLIVWRMNGDQGEELLVQLRKR
jgi:serine protease Do